MNRRIVKLLSCFIPSRKLRHKFRDRFSPKCSILKDNGKNNRLIILDDEGQETESKYIKNLEVIFEGDNNEIRMYQSYLLGTKLSLVCKNDVKISIGKSPYWNHIKLEYFINDKSQLIVGDNCSFRGIEFVFYNEPELSVQIGDDCMFSDEILISPSDWHTLLDLESKKILNFPHDIKIGNHCWIGKCVKILKGANIPDNSVVGMGSIYTKGSNPDISRLFGGGVFIGSPARLVKSGVTWNRENTYDYLLDRKE